MSGFDLNIYINILQWRKLSVFFVIYSLFYRKISDKENLYKGLRIRPEKEKIDLYKNMCFNEYQQ